MAERIVTSRNSEAFALLRSDGSVVTWGLPPAGGDSSAVQDVLADVREICAADEAFVAILGNGTLVTWGATLALTAVALVV